MIQLEFFSSIVRDVIENEKSKSDLNLTLQISYSVKNEGLVLICPNTQT